MDRVDLTYKCNVVVLFKGITSALLIRVGWVYFSVENEVSSEDQQIK